MEPNESTDVAIQQQQKSNIALSNKGVVLTTFDELWRFSVAISKSGMAPKGMEKPESILIAIQMGLELGLTAMASLQNIAVINGRPTIWGDAAKALVLSSPICEYVNEYYEGEGDNMVAWCISKRKGREEHKTSFSMKEAKSAGLLGKQGPWTTYPKRMLMMRSRGFELRDNFTDVLKGFITYEEVADYEDLGNVKKNIPIEVKTEKIQSTTAKAMEKIKQIGNASTSTAMVKPETVAHIASVIQPNENFATEGSSSETADQNTEEYTEVYLKDLTIQNIYGVCKELGIDYEAFEGANTNKKCRTLILEKQMGMPSSISLNVNTNDVTQEAQEQAGEPTEGLDKLIEEIHKIGDLDASGKRSFSDMKQIFSILDAYDMGNDRIAYGIKQSGLEYANKESLCKSGTKDDIITIINNCQ